MLKRLVLLVVAAILATGASAAQPNGAPKNQQQAAQSQPAVRAANAVDKEINGQTGDPKADGKLPTVDRTTSTWWSKPEWWTLIVTALAAGIVSWQSWETRVAAQGTLIGVRAQMNAERAWVLLHEMRDPPPLHECVDQNIIPGIVWIIKFCGNTPARVIREQFRCHIVPAWPSINPPEPNISDSPEFLTFEMPYMKQFVAEPGSKKAISSPLESGLLTHGELLDLKRGDSVLCAYGRIEYTDAFDRMGVTQFCAVYRFQFGGVIKSPGPNAVDLNAPGFRIGGPIPYNETT